MLHRKLAFVLATFLMVVAYALPVQSQSNSDQLKACETQTASFQAWTGCLIDKVATPIVNQRHPAKQVEMTSLAENTTSLVDQTSAPDLVGLALNLAGLKSNSEGGSNTSGAITTSAFALYAAAKNRDPLDPDFYKKHPDLRRFSFTFGRDAGNDAAAKTKRRSHCPRTQGTHLELARC